jgi:hypothetical protein
MKTSDKLITAKYETAFMLLQDILKGDGWTPFSLYKFFTEYHMSRSIRGALIRHKIIMEHPEKRGFYREGPTKVNHNIVIAILKEMKEFNQGTFQHYLKQKVKEAGRKEPTGPAVKPKREPFMAGPPDPRPEVPFRAPLPMPAPKKDVRPARTIHNKPTPKQTTEQAERAGLFIRIYRYFFYNPYKSKK